MELELTLRFASAFGFSRQKQGHTEDFLSVGQTPRTFTALSRETGFLVGPFVFTTTQKVA